MKYTYACLHSMLLSLCVIIAASAQDNDTKPQAQESLLPILREVHIPVDDESAIEVQPEQKITIEALSGDLTALRQAVESARKIISEGKIEDLDIDWTDDSLYQKKNLGVGRQKKGEAVVSMRLGHNHLEIQAYADDSYDVTAKIGNGQLVNIYSELLYLIGKNWDDQQVLNRNQLINVHISQMPWQQALTIILGQGGLAWHEEESKGREKIVVYPVRNHPRIKEDLHNLALDAWDKASQNRQNGVAAQALYQRARQYFDGEQYSAAIRTFFDVSDTFQEQAEKDPQVRYWVKQAQLGIGDTMMALKQYREARSVYLNYLSLALENEDISSDVYIKAAQASQLYGQEVNDIIAREKAEDILDNMLLKYRNDKRAANNIVRANYMLGVLMMDKEEFRAAKEYFKAFRNKEGGNHRLDSYLAQCEFELAKELKARGDYKSADKYFSSAQSIYKNIASDYRNNRADPLIKESISHVYQSAFFRIGECHLSFQRPAFPEALVAFLTAREQFPDSDLDGQVLVKIAHCFSRLHADEHAIAKIQEMLGSRGLADTDV
ncbi:MAG: hypothetical protein HRU15_19255, partial [Planctomycetes bacterium]|nr:hypothetical protein [Planctomycetota bacterium]